ncbi:bis(5'-nucleosyl)-tetraphosphatase PrpE [Bacillus sp. NPDC077027]|uniref:bis(5'-nucleosyl)-tetraphosphatase PrpE n=1 Tax=Bacillus sp. NPDC077027 TaxID=3390548 RepID=UPI003D01809A
MKFDIIGDIHGCYEELIDLLTKLGYELKNGLPIHPEGRTVALVGDLTDRGPQSVEVMRFVIHAWRNKAIRYVPGNHCFKLYRYLKGNPVKLLHGIETTVNEIKQLQPQEQHTLSADFKNLFEQAPLYELLDDGKLIITHAAMKEKDIGKTPNKEMRSYILFGDVTGEILPNGRPVRKDWAKNYKGNPWIVYGHTPVKTPRIVGRTVNIDTGCVFGNQLSALRYPEFHIVSVPSSMPYDESRFQYFTQ